MQAIKYLGGFLSGWIHPRTEVKAQHLELGLVSETDLNLEVDGQIPLPALLDLAFRSGYLRVKKDTKPKNTFYTVGLTQALADKANATNPPELLGAGAYVMDQREIKRRRIPGYAVVDGPFLTQLQAAAALLCRKVAERKVELEVTEATHA